LTSFVLELDACYSFRNISYKNVAMLKRSGFWNVTHGR